MTTAGILLPITSASSSGNLEDGPGHYQHRNRTHSLPFPQSRTQSQSQSQTVSETTSHSDCNPFLPQDTVQRISGTTSTPTTSPTTTTGGGGENVNLRWDGSRPESGDNGVENQHDHGQSQGSSRQQKVSRREALAQILEYHRESLACSLVRKHGTEGEGDGDKRGKRKRRNSDVELDGDGVERAYTPSSTTQQQQAFRQPPASSSSASAGPSSLPWSSSTMTNNNNTNTNNALSFAPFGEDVDDSSSQSTNGLQLEVCTVGHLMPRNKVVNEGNWCFNTNGSSGGSSSNATQILGNFMYEPTAAETETLRPLCEDGNEDDEDVEIVPPGILTTGPPSTPTISSTTETPLPSPSSLLPPPRPPSSSSSQQKLRVRRAAFVPGGWAVPPRVLLVDDDAVIRKLSSKFLKIFGCTTDVAVDGIGAVTKMNLEKYDLVLMV